MTTNIETSIKSFNDVSKQEEVKKPDAISLHTSFVLLYLVFWGVYTFIHQLGEIFKEIVENHIKVYKNKEPQNEINEQVDGINNNGLIESTTTDSTASSWHIDKDILVQNQK